MASACVEDPPSRTRVSPVELSSPQTRPARASVPVENAASRASPVRAVLFVGSVWLFCFLYSFEYLVENWHHRAHLLLDEHSISYDCLGFSEYDRLILGVNIASAVTLTALLGFSLNVLHAQPDQRHAGRTDKRKPVAYSGPSSVADVARSYALILVCAGCLALAVYAWCYCHYTAQSGMTYYYGSHVFTSPEAFARIAAGFFTSVLMLSYLDTFGMRKHIGIAAPTRSSSLNRALSIMAFMGLGGFGGVAGAVAMIARDLASRAVSQLYPFLLGAWHAGEFSTEWVAAVLALALMIVGYRVLFRATYPRTRDTFDRRSAAFEARRRRSFPTPYPNGWYRLCDVRELDHGRIKSISALGLDLVVFRGEDGSIGVLDAFCPHMGAHIGQGGRVVGNTVECPFHNWRFDARGKVTHIPYTSAPVPSSCRTKSWPTRTWGGMLFLWFDAEGREPLYEMDYPREIEQPGWYYGGVTQLEFDQHVSEMAENSADYFHFATLHKPLPLPLLERLFTVKHDVRLRFDPDPAKKHTCYFDNDAGVYFLDRWCVAPAQEMRVTFEGPAQMFFRISIWPFGSLVMSKTLLPIAPFHQYTEDRWWAESSVPRWFGVLLAVIARRALDQDRVVWENKTFNKRPMLVKDDGPFPQFRRWYRQFYSEHSKDVSQNLLDW